MARAISPKTYPSAEPCCRERNWPKERGPTETLPGRKAETDRVCEGISEGFHPVDSGRVALRSREAHGPCIPRLSLPIRDQASLPIAATWFLARRGAPAPSAVGPVSIVQRLPAAHAEVYRHPAPDSRHCRSPKNSPGPRMRRSSSAITNPSVDRTSASSRSRAADGGSPAALGFADRNSTPPEAINKQ